MLWSSQGRDVLLCCSVDGMFLSIASCMCVLNVVHKSSTSAPEVDFSVTTCAPVSMSAFSVVQSAEANLYVFLWAVGVVCGLVSKSVIMMSWSLMPGMVVLFFTSEGCVVRTRSRMLDW